MADINDNLDSGFDDLISEIEALRPEPAEDFTTRLDSRVEEGFAKPAARKVEWKAGRRDSMRRLFAPLAAGLAAILIVAIAVPALIDSSPQFLSGAADDAAVVVDSAEVEESVADADEEAYPAMAPESAEPDPESLSLGSSPDRFRSNNHDRAAEVAAEEAGESAAPESSLAPPATVTQSSRGAQGETTTESPSLGPATTTTEEPRTHSPSRLPLILIAAGAILLIPVFWFSSQNLRRRFRERVLDW